MPVPSLCSAICYLFSIPLLHLIHISLSCQMAGSLPEARKNFTFLHAHLNLFIINSFPSLKFLYVCRIMKIMRPPIASALSSSAIPRLQPTDFPFHPTYSCHLHSVSFHQLYQWAVWFWTKPSKM